jgi:membrane associated rhomboid family serine protease
MNFTDTPVTFILIACNVLFSLIGFSSAAFTDKMIMWPYLIKRKQQYYRLFTSGFLHADLIHLFFNMFTLYFFGSALEYYFANYELGGTIAYIALYIISLPISDIPSYLKHKDDNNYRSLGASGAVCAVLFATLVFGPWNQVQLYGIISISFLVYAVLFIIYCINMGKHSHDHVNHDAHLWGSVFGLVFTLLLIVTINPELFDLVIKEFSHPSLLGRMPIYLK